MGNMPETEPTGLQLLGHAEDASGSVLSRGCYQQQAFGLVQGRRCRMI